MGSLPDNQAGRNEGRPRTPRRIARDAARLALRNGDVRLALGILIWHPGWSHTKLQKPPSPARDEEVALDGFGI